MVLYYNLEKYRASKCLIARNLDGQHPPAQRLNWAIISTKATSSTVSLFVDTKQIGTF